MKLLVVLLALAAISETFAVVQKTERASDEDGMGQTCALCQFALQTVEGFISDTSTEAEIFGFLEKVCGMLPSNYSEEEALRFLARNFVDEPSRRPFFLERDLDDFARLCKYLIDTKGPSTIEWIIDEQNPEVVCQELRLCPNSTMAARWAAQILPHRANSVDLCPSCRVVVLTVESMTAQQSTVADIQSHLHGLCAKIPGAWGHECSRLAGKVPNIVEWLKANEGSAKFCSQMGICTSGY